MKKLLLAGVAALGMTLSATGADAAFVGTVPLGGSNNNQVIAPLTQIEGIYGANLYLVGGQSTTITATLIGYEAGNTNSFLWNGGTLFSGTGQLGTLGGPIGTSIPIAGVLAGLLPFAFTTSSGGPAANATNGRREPHGAVLEREGRGQADGARSLQTIIIKERVAAARGLRNVDHPIAIENVRDIEFE